MTTEQKIKMPVRKRLLLWTLVVLVLSAICVIYHSTPSARFHPFISALLIVLISVWLLFVLEIPKLIRDRSFSGNIVEMNVYSKLYMKSVINKDVYRRTFVNMSIRCDDGRVIKFEQMLPEHETRAVPYRIGDRVLHIKYAPHLCRFPRNDTETLYDPISVICPVCGALHPLGSKTCAFCETKLPRDTIIK